MTMNTVTTKESAKQVLAILLFGFGIWLLADLDEAVGGEKPERPTVKVVEGGESHLQAAECRKMIVGQPKRGLASNPRCANV